MSKPTDAPEPSEAANKAAKDLYLIMYGAWPADRPAMARAFDAFAARAVEAAVAKERERCLAWFRRPWTPSRTELSEDSLIRECLQRGLAGIESGKEAP